MDTVKLNDQISLGPQPSADQLKELARQGFKSVVNVRTDGEDEQPLSPAEEGQIVEGLGLTYLHIPFSTKSMGSEAVDQFREQFPSLPQPVFAHCKTYNRAGAMVTMHLASGQGMNGQEAVRRAEAAGIDFEQPELRRFVAEYVDQHAGVLNS